MDTSAIEAFLSARPELLAKGVTVESVLSDLAKEAEKTAVVEALENKRAKDATLSSAEFAVIVSEFAVKVSEFVEMTAGNPNGGNKNTKYDRQQFDVPTALGSINVRLVHDTV